MSNRSLRLGCFLLACCVSPLAGQAVQASPEFHGSGPPADTRGAAPSPDRFGAWVCGVQASADAEVVGRWDQARAGLLAVRASFQSDSYEFIAVTSARYTRGGYFLPGAYWAAALPVSDPPVRLTSWPIAAPPPESLAASGFIANAEDTWNGPRWYGPDPAFLLSAGFFGRYCFRAVGAEVTPAPARRDPSVPEGAVGLEFRPDDSSPRNMVRGVLWLDPASASLTAIEWTYVRLPSWARARPEFKSEGGGWVELAHLDGASVFPRRWSMQVPFPRKEPGRYTSRIERYWVGAGHVILVRGESGEIVARYPD